MNTHPVGNVAILRGVIGGSITKLAASPAIGATTVTVYDATGYTNNDPVIINPGKPTEERRTINGAPGGITLTLNSALLHSHMIGEEVIEASTPGTVVCTVKRPDGTTVSSTPGTVVPGVYEAEFTTAQKGVHYYTFIASGSVVATLEGAFNVDDTAF